MNHWKIIEFYKCHFPRSYEKKDHFPHSYEENDTALSYFEKIKKYNEENVHYYLENTGKI